MSFLLRNVVRDTKFEHLRLAHPTEVSFQPSIDGVVLPVGAIRVLRPDEITLRVFKAIEKYQRSGCVQLLRTGPNGGEVNLGALRTEIGLPSDPVERAVPAEALVAALEKTPDQSESDATAYIDPDEAEYTEHEAAPEEPRQLLPPERDPVALDDILDSGEEETQESFTEAHLRTLKNDELRSILATFSVPVTGKNKDVLIAEILDNQSRAES